MKLFLYFLLAVLVSSCKQQPQSSHKLSKVNKKASLDDKDSVSIYKDDQYSIKYTKKELRTIINQFPELNEQSAPDFAYAKRACKVLDYSSETGRDDYYALYAYFLKQKNGDVKFQAQRKTLLSIYRHINSLYGTLALGGTYFGHQYIRIIGYAEYSIFLRNNNQDDYNKSYNIDKQKTLYLNSLRQFITDELNSTFDLKKEEKPKIKKELFETVNDIDRLLTDYFYLESARVFQYSNY